MPYVRFPSNLFISSHGRWRRFCCGQSELWLELEEVMGDHLENRTRRANSRELMLFPRSTYDTLIQPPYRLFLQPLFTIITCIHQLLKPYLPVLDTASSTIVSRSRWKRGGLIVVYSCSSCYLRVDDRHFQVISSQSFSQTAHNASESSIRSPSHSSSWDLAYSQKAVDLAFCVLCICSAQDDGRLSSGFVISHLTIR